MAILFQNSYFDVDPISSKIAHGHSMLFRKDGFDVVPKNEFRCYSATLYRIYFANRVLFKSTAIYANRQRHSKLRHILEYDMSRPDLLCILLF
jgi:hypothetical protein